MGEVQTKAFKSGNSVAVRFPKSFGLAAGMPLTIESRDGQISIRPVSDPEQEARRFRAMLDDIEQIWAEADGAPRPEARDPDIFPDRPGLY